MPKPTPEMERDLDRSCSQEMIKALTRVKTEMDRIKEQAGPDAWKLVSDALRRPN